MVNWKKRFSPKIMMKEAPDRPTNQSLWNLAVLVLSLVLLVGAMKYQETQRELFRTQSLLETQSLNEKILNFNGLFIEKVLKAESEVDSETRLKLENAIRDLNDEDVSDSWRAFVDSRTEGEAQKRMLDLLEILAKKIRPVK